MAIGDYMMSDSKQISFGFDCSYSLRSVDFIKSGYLMNYLALQDDELLVLVHHHIINGEISGACKISAPVTTLIL